MHRFYMFHSFTKFHRNPMAEACLFLAAKVEEQPRKLEHVIKSYHICVNRDQGQLDVKSEAYLEMAQELVCNENILLQTLGFDISVEHPHQNVVKTCTLVKASKDLAQTSYFLATNSLHLTTMCLKYRHTVVACVCIHLACKWSNYQIPCSSEGKHWFQYVDKDVSLTLLEDLTQEFLNILDNCPSKLKKKILTWKSGQRPAEDVITGATNEKKPKLDTADGGGGHRPQQQRPGEPSGSGLRRVQTEPVLAYSDRKPKQGHPPPAAGSHHREIPGYHNKAGPPTQQHPSSQGWSASRPTHPPPPPKGRHHPSNRPPPHTPEKRSNIFDQMASEQTKKSGQRPMDSTPDIRPGHKQPSELSSQKLPSEFVQKHPYEVGTSHKHGPDGRPIDDMHHSKGPPKGVIPHSKGTAPQPTSAENEPTLSTREKIMQAHALNKKKEEQRMATVASQRHKSPIAASNKQKIAEPPQTVSVVAQAKHEQDMQEKLQAELKKQEELKKNKKLKMERERKEKQDSNPPLKSPNELKSPLSGKSPKLRSPPMLGRQKSDSRSDSDTPGKTPSKEERHRLFQEHQEKIVEDRKRLRRVSEELGDPKIEQKPVVMLDNVFMSPDKGKNEFVSPGKSGTPGTGAGLSTTPLTGTPGNGIATTPVNKEVKTEPQGNTPTPSRTISLEKYRERKPLSQSQSRTGTPTQDVERQNLTDKPGLDKPTLAMEHLASIKLQGLKPLSEILKPTDTKNGLESSPKKPRIENTLKMGQHARKNSNSSMVRKNSSTSLEHHGQAVESISSNLTKGIASTAIKTETSSAGSGTTMHLKHTKPHTKAVPPSGAVSSHSPAVAETDSPKEKKLSLKIKIGANPAVTMSPDKSSDVKDQQRSERHREGKHEKKRHHRRDGRESKSSKYVDSNKGTTDPAGDPSRSMADASKPGDLKVTLNLKELKHGGDSPFKIDNPIKTETAPSGQAIPPMKLVIQKDKSGHYSSGHKSHKHSKDKPRKRSHSPGVGGGSGPNTPVVPMKIPRSDSSASLGFDVNGTCNSPAADKYHYAQQGIQKLIDKQKKNIEITQTMSKNVANSSTSHLPTQPRK